MVINYGALMIRFQTFASGLVLLLLLAATPVLGLEVGTQAPKFTLANLDHKQVALDSFKGRMIVLKIGTTWCPGCQAQSRELQRADDFLLAEGVTLIEVFVDESAPVVKGYGKNHPLKTPVQVLLGDEDFASDYGVYLIPRLLILGPDLKILVDSGGLTAEEIKARLVQLKAASKKP